ncbi:cytoplasmic tRNA 2-thiolation protein 2, putative [Plasmodium vivax]|uniref:Cytoplasmic tRNA 2-thiolation protein 2, putative n=1 Tax=Plasmodium vivax TaxID=5855 RepID=A0A1G4H2G0_PLAVI|nr:cytoplasmic tRNA 2-thiolation protein 2, putative [Plasmodium vivax]
MKANCVLCYKCKKNNAVVCTREKSCKDCFLQLVEYTFKNTLREKCLFKNKGGHNFQLSRQLAQKNDKREDMQERKCNKPFAHGEYAPGEHAHFAGRSCCKELNEGMYSDGTQRKGKTVTTLSTQQQRKKTAIAFSGEICSSFLLFLFVKYLKNVKNRKNDLLLTNEYCVFSEIIFVDIFQDENYILSLIGAIEEIFRRFEESGDSKGGNDNEVVAAADEVDKSAFHEAHHADSQSEHRGEETQHSRKHDKTSPPEGSDRILFLNGVFKKKINKVHFTVLKSNYFVNEHYKSEFLVHYDLVKKEKNYYLNYINELIIYNAILKYSIDENINYVLFGNNANNISNKSFLYTIFGNGINLPICTAYIDNRYKNINFIKPLRDLLNKEIYIYCYYKNIAYLRNTSFDGNIVYRTINEMLSSLDSKNNTSSIINNTTGNLINMVNMVNLMNVGNEASMASAAKMANLTSAKRHPCGGKNKEDYILIDVNTQDGEKNSDVEVVPEKLHSYSDIERDHAANYVKKCTNTYKSFFACYICSGNKETQEEKQFIKKMNKIQLTNLEKMKHTSLICSTCLSIFSSSDNCVNLFNVFFNI